MQYVDLIHNLKFLKRVFVKPGLPIQLVYFVTTDCNSRCAHCFLKDRLNKERETLDLDEIKKVSLSIPLLASISLTGGEPFLRPDLSSIAEIFYMNSKAKSIVITTNGYLTDNILTAVDEICKKCRRSTVFLGVSLDGIGESHDILRGLKGSFKNAVNTFNALIAMKEQHKNLSVGVNMTFSRYNQDRIGQVYEYVRDEMRPDNVGINFMRGKCWNDVDDVRMDVDKYRSLTNIKLNDYMRGRMGHSNAGFIGKLTNIKELLQYDMIANIYLSKKYMNRCYAGTLLAVMSSNGDVYPCEMLGERMGNVRDFEYNLRKLWFSGSADKVRRSILCKRCFCTYECAMTANILFNPRYYLKIISGLLERYNKTSSER